MKKQAVALLLCIVLILLLLPGAPAAADERLNFISIDDNLPEELINCVVAYGGVIYVPYYIFSNYGLGISYSFFNSASAAYLYSGDKQLFFELTTGDTYDGEDNHYSGSAILQRGTVYVPLGLMQRFFGGFSYSYIAGNEYGNILRITTDAAVLSDTDFLRAARNTMWSYYVTYNSMYTLEPVAEPTATPAPSPSVTPSPEPVAESPEPTAELTHVGERLTLGFVGLPADRVLSTLAQTGIRTCFFLTHEDVRTDPDLVRRIIGEGHSVGIFCDDGEAPGAALTETAALLFEAARARTLLVTSPSEIAGQCRTAAEAEDMVFCGIDFNDAETGEPLSSYGVVTWLESSSGENPALLLHCGADSAPAVAQFLRYLAAQQYDVVCPREASYA